jgi:hypothetical protein
MKHVRARAYLIRFLDLILGALMAEPTNELPTRKIPLERMNDIVIVREYCKAVMQIE